MPVHVHTGGVGGGLQASSSTVRRDFLRQSLTEHGDHSFGETCCLSNPRDPSFPASPALELQVLATHHGTWLFYVGAWDRIQDLKLSWPGLY